MNGKTGRWIVLGLMLLAGTAAALDPACTTEGRATEAWVPLRYCPDMPVPSAEAAAFSRAPRKAMGTPMGGVLVETVETAPNGEQAYFTSYGYSLSADGKSLNLWRERLTAPGGANVQTNSISYRTREPGVFVIDGKVLRFEQYPNGRVRALYEGRLGKDGQVQDEKELYRSVQNLGRVIFIGDSITHGVGAPSYRWALHKILVDNAVLYEEMGVEQGSCPPDDAGVKAGTTYRGVPFYNLHCAMSGERASELAGRTRAPARPNAPARLDATCLKDWLGLTPGYNGPRRLPAVPDTAFILAGTNDLLGSFAGRFYEPQNLAALKKALLDAEQGDMSVLVQALRQVNPQVSIIVLTVPTWSYHSVDHPDAFSALADYNRALIAWAAEKNIIVADVNTVLADVTQWQYPEEQPEVPGRGVSAFFYAEPRMGIHPSVQGDLLMAGVVAHALGLPGRLAQHPLVATRAKRYRQAESLAPGEEQEIAFPAAAVGVQVYMHQGWGSRHVWEKERGLALTLGDGQHSGRLRITESAIIWGDGTTLFAARMRDTRDVLVMWMEGEVEAGYYVWLGDMLIGEALPSDGADFCGMKLENQVKSPVKVSYFTDENPQWQGQSKEEP